MPTPAPLNNDRALFLQALLLAGAGVLALFLWQGHKGFDLADEGFLWYGAQRVMLGEVPIRDFMSYDPGRYYWSAPIMLLLGDNGILALRAAAAAFQALGLGIALFLVLQHMRGPRVPLALMALVTLLVWMFPRHNYFDITVSIALVGALAFLIQSPTARRYLLAGVVVGLTAFFGRNHGVYGVMGSVGVLVWLALGPWNTSGSGPSLPRGGALWSLGVVLGYLPMLAMLALVPEYVQPFWESILFLFEINTTNLTLPVPWPWTVPTDTYTTVDYLRRVLAGVFFMALLAFPLLGIPWVGWRRIKGRSTPPALTAAVFMALPYAHYAFSRADIPHLALSVFPLLIGGLVLAARCKARLGYPLAVMLCLTSLLVMFPTQPGWKCLGGQCVEVQAGNDTLAVRPRHAEEIALLQRVVEAHAPDGQSFVVLPFWPTSYALFDRKSPLWDICALWPRNEAFERREILRMQVARPAFVLLHDVAVDGREDLLYENTHPLLYQYFMENFTLLPGFFDDPDLKLYVSPPPPQ